MVSSSGAASHLPATHTLSSSVLHCCASKRPFLCAICERQVQLVNKTIVGPISFKPCRNPAMRGEPWPREACCTGIAGCCSLAAVAKRRPHRRVPQQFPPSDADCHTPLPCEVRRGKDTTPRACC